MRSPVEHEFLIFSRHPGYVERVPLLQRVEGTHDLTVVYGGIGGRVGEGVGISDDVAHT